MRSGPNPGGREPREPREPVVRVAEARWLDSALEALAGGWGGVVELEGDPGTGKTRLLGHVAARAHALGIRVLRGRSGRADREVPFHAVTEPLGPGAVAGLDPAADPEQVHPALRSALTALATEPVLLLLDDFHLADGASARFVEYLTRYPVSAPVLVVVAQRPREACRALRNAITQAVDAGTGDRLTLAPLTAAQAALLVGADPADEALLDLHRRAEGNPLYLLALSRAEVGDRLGVLLAGELAGLAPDEAAVLHAGAVLGTSFVAVAAARVADLAPDATCAAVAGLLRRDLLREVPQPGVLRFRHEVLRDVVYRRIDWCVREAAHRRALEVLADRPARERVPHVESAPRPDDVPLLVAAAREAAVDAPGDAVRWLRLAGEVSPDRLPPAADLLARALVADGGLTEARDVLAAAIADGNGDRAALVAEQALLECFLGDYPGAGNLLSAELAGTTDPDALVRLVARRVMVGLFDGDLPDDAEIERVAGVDTGGAGQRVAAMGALAVQALRAAHTGDVNAAHELITGCAALADALPDAELADHPDHLTVLGWAETIVARFDDALRHLGRQLALLRRQPTSCLLPIVLMGLSWVHHCVARLEETRESAAEAKRVAQRLGSPHVANLAEMLEAAYLAWTNGRGGSRLAVDRAERAARAKLPRNWWFGTNGLLLLASALHMDGDTDRATAVILGAGGGPDLAFVSPMTRPWCYETLSSIAADNGDTGGAEEWARRAAEAAEFVGQPNHVGFALLARAHALRAGGEHCQAAELYREAAESFATLGMTGSRIRALNHAAGSSQAAGRAEQAGADLLLARELARQVGATVVYESADQQRHRLTPRRADAVDLSVLTRREAQIARIAATGKRSRDIAEELVMSPRTVDLHLTRVYRKLGVSSRAELVRLLASLG
ncbi:LuxR C-terminal-related transcriptional regulator [Saccharothrix syringae]|uniref:LuxR C-terminal-related transcriptional regulator n=1 Tax=Saccharothrix syringae TaxID=103733 RepID=UPI000525B72F|nr:LuxR C-terminal-related transcriptional regulator [Saccharothrix syringae]